MGPKRCQSGSGGIEPAIGMVALGEGAVVVRGGGVFGVFVVVVRFGAGCRRRRGGGRRSGAAARRPALRASPCIYIGVMRVDAWL